MEWIQKRNMEQVSNICWRKTKTSKFLYGSQKSFFYQQLSANPHLETFYAVQLFFLPDDTTPYLRYMDQSVQAL